MRAAGGRALIVGGAVRDLLRGADAVKDVDIEVFGVAPEALCRTLGAVDWIDMLAPASETSPLEIAKRGRMRLRAAPARKGARRV